jgi:hypothetical protein
MSQTSGHTSVFCHEYELLFLLYDPNVTLGIFHTLLFGKPVAILQLVTMKMHYFGHSGIGNTIQQAMHVFYVISRHNINSSRLVHVLQLFLTMLLYGIHCIIILCQKN